MPTSAMPKAGGDEGVDLVGVDRLGAVEGDAQAGQVELVGPLERPRGQHVREVRPGGGGAAVGRDPLHPPGGAGGEVLGGAEHQAGAGRHGERHDPDQAHVVVERQPGHQHVVLDVELPGAADGVEVGAQDVVGEHHALGVGRRPACELQDGEPVVVDRGAHPGGGVAGGQLADRDHRWVARLGRDEGGEVGVHDHEGGVGAADAAAGLRHELLDGREPHRQGQHHDRGAGQPRRLDGGDELAGGGRQQAHLVARPYPPGLEGGGVRLRLFVDTAPGDDVLGASDDERDVAVCLGRARDPVKEGEGSHDGRTSRLERRLHRVIPVSQGFSRSCACRRRQ
jgi:hypothetical protein